MSKTKLFESQFKCPNCSQAMFCVMQTKHKGEKYDKWECEDCPILVLDWRASGDTPFKPFHREVFI